VSLDFWSDAKVICETCKGERFKPEVLSIRVSELNISDVLKMSFSEAFDFFSHNLRASAWKKIGRIFSLAQKAGLGYISIGQSLNTLSTGELQRLKLIQGLASVSDKNTLIILDEPTGGLHPDDTIALLTLFDELIAYKNSILCVTHDSIVSNYADHLIELGPEGGQKGGYVVPASLTS
jgi:excinuclease ABC subunit A